LLVKRALHRADTVTVRFLIGLSLVEYCLFWWHASDGKGVTDALRQAAGYSLDERVWGSAFASRLANSDLLRSVDQLPIFGANKKTVHIESASLKPYCGIRLISRAGVQAHPRANGFPRTLSQAGAQYRASRAEYAESPSFAETFLGCARKMLDTATITALAELAKERLTPQK
jgi:hypothetical protein